MKRTCRQRPRGGQDPLLRTGQSLFSFLEQGARGSGERRGGRDCQGEDFVVHSEDWTWSKSTGNQWKGGDELIRTDGGWAQEDGGRAQGGDHALEAVTVLWGKEWRGGEMGGPGDL